jgi:anti-anti-sigma regulatory factor
MTEAFPLPAELSIYNVLETRDALQTHGQTCSVAGDSMVPLSGAGVESIDGAGLQLLISLSRSDPPWQLTARSAALNEALAGLGLQDLLSGQGEAT